MANVKYIISQERLDRNADLKDKVEKVNDLVYRLVNYLPRTWLVAQRHQIKNGIKNDLTDRSFDPISSDLQLGRKERQSKLPFLKEVDHIRYKKNSSIHIEAKTDVPALLIISESFYPGWKVFVNGQEKELLCLNPFFQGVEIPPGKHSIVFKFRPKYFNLFLFISLASLALLFSIWLLFAAKRRFKP